MNLIEKWRSEAKTAENSCRQAEGRDDRSRADQHYQIKLTFEQCADELEAEMKKVETKKKS